MLYLLTSFLVRPRGACEQVCVVSDHEVRRPSRCYIFCSTLLNNNTIDSLFDCSTRNCPLSWVRGINVARRRPCVGLCLRACHCSKSLAFSCIACFAAADIVLHVGPVDQVRQLRAGVSTFFLRDHVLRW